MSVIEYREYINPVTGVLKRKRTGLIQGIENSFIAGSVRVDDNSIQGVYAPEELLSNPKTKVTKSKPVLPIEAPGEINHRESVTDRELAGTQVSEAEKVKLDLQEPLVLTEIADVVTWKVGERQKLTLEVTVVPSIVTGKPLVEPAKGPIIERQTKKPTVQTAVKQQQVKTANQEAVVQKAKPEAVRQAESESEELEIQELESEKPEESLTQQQEEEAEQLRLAKLEEARRKAELEKQLRLAKLEEDRLKEEAEKLRLAKLEEERLKKEAERLAKELNDAKEELQAAKDQEVKAREKLDILKGVGLELIEIIKKLEEEAEALIKSVIERPIEDWIKRPSFSGALLRDMMTTTEELDKVTRALELDYQLTVEELEKAQQLGFVA